MFVCYWRLTPWWSEKDHKAILSDPVTEAFDSIWMIPPAPGVWDV